MINLNPTLTAAGLALFSGQSPGFNVVITAVAFGAQKYDPSGFEGELRAELARFPIDGSALISPNTIQVGVLMKSAAPDGRSANNQWIGEIGFYAGNTLFAVLSNAAAYLFFKSPDIDIPVTYVLDFSVLPPGSITVNNDALSSSIALASSYAQTAAKTASDSLVAIQASYYGPFAAAPITRPDGSPRQKGDRYFDTSFTAEMTWSGKAWFVANLDTARLADNGAALVGYEGATLKKFLDRASTSYGWASSSDLPRFMKFIRSYRSDLRLPTNVVYFGSSVDNAAGLADRDNDAPGAYFVRMLKKYFDPGDLYNIKGHNFSKDGSTMSEFPVAWARMVAAGITPHLVIIGYNMNDQAPAIFNSGQTFPGYQSALRDAIFIVNRAGCDVVKLNGPHPAVVSYPAVHSMPANIEMTYPTVKNQPVLPEQLEPPVSKSVVRADFLGEGVKISLGYRMLRIQQAARDICREFGAVLIDGESFYMASVQDAQERLGTPELVEAEFFDPGQYVHPNLKGHMASYWLAIDAFMHSFARQGGQSNLAPQMNGYIWMNRRAGTGTAGLEVNTPYPDRSTVPFNVLARVGVPDANTIPAELPMVAVDPSNGDLVLGNGIQRFSSNLVMGGVAADGASREMRPYGANFKERICGEFNALAPWTLKGFPDNAMGELTVIGAQGGIVTSPQMKKLFWKSRGGVMQIAANGADPWGSGTFTVAVGAGLTLVVTPVAINTNFNAYWWGLSS